MTLKQPHHLPQRRPNGKAADPSWLPRQRRGVTPQMIGRYPDYDVFDALDTWDDATRDVVLARLAEPTPLRFFSAEEQPTLRAFCDTVLAQDSEPRVPAAESIDAKLAEGHLDGFQYADMPDDRDTWRLVLAGLDHTAHIAYQCGFAEAGARRREHIVEEFSQGRLVGGPWDELNVARAWSVVMRAALSGFYAHPWAWNEIGFGGPAYPRGFMRLGGSGAQNGRHAAVREPFEKPGAVDLDPVRDVEGDPEPDPGRVTGPDSGTGSGTGSGSGGGRG